MISFVVKYVETIASLLESLLGILVQEMRRGRYDEKFLSAVLPVFEASGAIHTFAW